MRISFDLDDTIVCTRGAPVERLVPRWLGWRYPEAMRRGTRALFRGLIERGCEVWIYTTSQRSARYIRGWFRWSGITIAGVVNQDRHDRVVGRGGPSKYPPAFGIALHFDDSSGVEREGERHGFEVVVIDPGDAEWAARVLAAAEARLALGKNEPQPAGTIRTFLTDGSPTADKSPCRRGGHSARASGVGRRGGLR